MFRREGLHTNSHAEAFLLLLMERRKCSIGRHKQRFYAVQLYHMKKKDYPLHPILLDQRPDPVYLLF